MRTIILTKVSILSLLFHFLLTGMVETLKMTVQVTVVPQATKELPLCSLQVLQSLSSRLTGLVIKATTPAIPDFRMLEQLSLTYRNPNHGRLLRRTSATRSAPESCTSCTSAGCSQYCGDATCDLCSDSRRRQLTPDVTPIHSQVRDDTDVERRELVPVDFNELGTQVTEIVQNSVQNNLLSSLVNVLSFDCFGDPQSLTINVSFLVV